MGLLLLIANVAPASRQAGLLRTFGHSLGSIEKPCFQQNWVFCFKDVLENFYNFKVQVQNLLILLGSKKGNDTTLYLR